MLPTENAPPPAFGFRANQGQLALHVFLAVLIGVTLRLTTFPEATVVASRVGDKYVSKTSFLVSFGFTKALSNLAVGRASDVWGRKWPHAVGWGFGILLGCLLLLLASITAASTTDRPHRLWVTYVLANVCLGAQQGWTWTTNIFMFLDILGPRNRAVASAVSNSVGYLTSAFATYLSAVLSADVSFGIVLGSSVLGCLISALLLKDTTHFVGQEAVGVQELTRYPDKGDEGEQIANTDTIICEDGEGEPNGEEERNRVVEDRFDLDGSDDHHTPVILQPSSFKSVFWGTCWHNPSAAVLCWGGLTANLVTSLAWGLVLIWGHQQDLTALQLANVGSSFTFSKAIAMIVSGFFSDRIGGRKAMLVGGFSVAAVGLLLTAWADMATNATAIYTRLCLGGIVIGSGIGGVYCVMTAGLSDHTPAQDRASAIGVYKLWRDSGYAFGGLLTGLVADASGGSFITTTTVVAGLVMVLVVSIIVMYEEVSKTRPSFEPVELETNENSEFS